MSAQSTTTTFRHVSLLCAAVSLALLPLTTKIYALGESAVITLVFPWGARTNAMGELGTSLADDESAPFYNPAGLGIPNERWEGGAFSFFYEPILPQLGIKDLFHTAWIGCYQYSGAVTAGFALHVNHLNFGENEWTDEFGRAVGSARAKESVFGLLSTGLGFTIDNSIHIGFGLSAKRVRSALAPGYAGAETGIGKTWAFDLGFLLATEFGFRFGFNLANMGPPIYYVDPNDPDPIPFMVNLGAGYKRLFTAGRLKIIQITSEFRIDRELVENHPYEPPDPFYKAFFTDVTNKTAGQNWELTQKHIGYEVRIFNTGAVQMGYLHDEEGGRYELHIGTGATIFNHFGIDGYIITVPGDTHHPRHGQWGISFNAFDIGIWKRKDLQWWLE